MRPAEIEFVRLRQGLYRFFAVAFSPPQAARLEQLDSAASLLDDLGVGTLAFADPWREMRDTLAGRGPFEELEARYVQLFQSGSDSTLCPPVESFYVSSPRQGGPAVVTADLETEYGRLGMAVTSTTELGADHLCPQLEAMALMCAEEAAAVEQGDLASVAAWNQQQRRFTDQHLSHWVPQFAARVRDTRASGLYPAFVAALAAFVDHDRELLHVLERRALTGPRP